MIAAETVPITIPPYTPPTSSMVHLAISLCIQLIRDCEYSPAQAARFVSQGAAYCEIDPDSRRLTPLLNAGWLVRAVKEAMGL